MNAPMALRRIASCLTILLFHVASADAQMRSRPQVADPAAAKSIDFFIHGHEDDWQIFMSPAAYRGAQNGEPIVFIYATAGDAGNADQNYWRAREADATRAVRAARANVLRSHDDDRMFSSGALGGTRTPTILLTATSRQRVYQFRHER
jgi:hypothetical protein